MNLLVGKDRIERRPVTFFLWLWLFFYCMHNDHPLQDMLLAQTIYPFEHQDATVRSF